MSISVAAYQATDSARVCNTGRPFNPLRTLQIWHERIRERSTLSYLSDETLDDIGISRAEIDAEARKPFWKA